MQRPTVLVFAWLVACKGDANIPPPDNGAVESICDDAVDNDDDGDLDCFDSDCADDPACGGLSSGTATGPGTGGATGTGTGGATGTGTGAATGTGTGTMGTGDSLVRFVHLVPEWGGELAVFLDEDASPLVEGLRPARATDAGGNDYLAIAAGRHDLSVVDDADRTDELAVLEGAAWPVDAYATVLIHGNPELGNSDPSLGVTLTVLDDNPRQPGAGKHRLTLIHVDPWHVGPIGTVVDAERNLLAYGESVTLSLNAGPTAMGVDLDGDATPDARFGLDLADADWSYAYIYPYNPDGVGAPEIITVLHHERGKIISEARRL